MGLAVDTQRHAAGNDQASRGKLRGEIERGAGTSRCAQAAADKGDNEAAVKLANKAKFEAEAAVLQYNYETANPRGM